MSGTITPTVRVRSVRSDDAAAFGRYFSRSLALRIFSLSAPETGWRESGLSARDTVETLTPTARATSFSVVRESPASSPPCYFAAFSYGMHQLAGLQLRRPDHDLLAHVLELRDVAAADVLELGVDDARLRPLAVRPERDRADDGVEGVLARM